MQVRMKVGDATAWLGNNGVTLYISDNDGNHIGKLRIGKAKVEWCKGRTRIGNGRKWTWRRLIDDHLEED